MSILTPAQLSQWQNQGFLVLRQPDYSADPAALAAWTSDLETRPETPGKWMKYFEGGPSRLLCRVENFLEHHAGFERLLRGPTLLGLVGELMGEPAALFKEKINFKLPGGNGFAAHQDAPAFVTFGQRYHITLMIAVDRATRENGCLEVVRGRHNEGLFPQAPDQTIAPDIAARLEWEAVPAEPGDIVLFDSYLPHRSGPNASPLKRRALYVTYSRASDGERRDDYYRAKRAAFPPEVERILGRDYSTGAGIYNVGNPIRD
jgi:hypothetical protein